ncbi:hypothetical protein [Oceanibium sediminis]|uniref:hypothetical protein n=1 Tax=Oceanibium sediminis TaxID=2026339 RepID=UPI0013006137|nr:hypothetical protein [Oceanibium sediminis]
MGHIHLGVLPNTIRWRQVVELLTEHAPTEEVIAASAVAVERDLQSAPDDPIFVESVRLLGMIPQAARGEQFGKTLRTLGLVVGDTPDLIEITSAAGAYLDRFAREHHARSDFGELSRRALLGTLNGQIGDQLPGLFEATPSDVRNVARKLSGSAQFSRLARAYFTRLLSETMASWLSRTLSTHVGSDHRFHGGGDRARFDTALNQYATEATRIISEFAGGWYGKTIFRDGEISAARAAAFGAIAFKKITEELRRKHDEH